MTPSQPGLTEEQKQRFSGLILLDRVISEPGGYHAALMENQDDTFLDPVFSYLQGEDLVEVGDDDHYRATDRGREAYQKLIQQRQSYLAHFEIYARVDLAEGTFGDPNEPFSDPRWSDVRIAVAGYKGIDPYRIVFLAMLADEAFFSDREWKFDLALGSDFFTELEEIVSSQITVEELGYQSEEGESVAGESVIEDVIRQGAEINRERWERERAAQQTLPMDQEDEGGPEEAGDREELVYVAYDPYQLMAMYAGSALFVEAMWLSAFW